MQLPTGLVAAFVLYEAALATPAPHHDVQVVKRQAAATTFDTYVNCLNSAVAAADASCSEYMAKETGQAVAYVNSLNLQDATVRVDTFIQGDDRLVARLIVNATIPSNNGSASSPVVFAKHVGMFFDAVGGLTEAHVQVDLSAIDTLATTYVDTSVYPNEAAVANVSIAEQFGGYMKNLQAAKFSALDLYFNEQVTQGGNNFDLSDFVAILNSSREAMPDLQLQADWIVADEVKQQLAAYVTFNGTLTEQWDVITWATVGPSNTTIDFQEYVLYWFENGKIRRVINTLDSPAFYDDDEETATKRSVARSGKSLFATKFQGF
ncbi:polyketide cyclase [Colletotrichum incanum]|uniref:Polyketide cyclase n=1 Tax=Colletotrichum incanum TaxID=1573173 RepID=A0A162MZG1_COLIC|nr:polyketide cyclase [Colletotrichum incanum]